MPSPGFKGAISELLACTYLMQQDYYVYRCESPCAPFDLVAYKDGCLLRVEVKSILRPRRTRLDGASFGPSVPWPVNEEWDLLIVVDREEGACYEITTHDQRVGVDQLRAACGYPPARVALDPMIVSP